jgi:1,4-dihydroxy-2-naphthoyl-CoA hydrolase
MITADQFNQRSPGHLPGLLGIRITAVEQGSLRAELPVRAELMAPNGFLHAGSVVTLADTACGYGCVAHLPEGASSFTTVELKSNHLGTTRDGTVQVWDAVVTHRESGRTLALFRCTQMVLYPKAA